MLRATVRRLVVSPISRNWNSQCWMCQRDFSSVNSRSQFRGDFKTGLLAQHAEVQVSKRLSSVAAGLFVQTPILTTTITRQIHNSSPTKALNLFTPRDDTTLWGRTLKKLGFTEIPKSILKASGYLMYMKVADEIDYLTFFKTCNLPDTFASWFTVVELHVWLLSTRLMQDGREGRIVRNSLVKAMWEDNELKSKKLEGALPSARRRELQGLNEQFHAVMISYDEGILGDDNILAGALWRRFLHLDSDPTSLLPEHFDTAEKHSTIQNKVKALEMLVIYVRSQFIMLNGLSREQLLRKRAFKFVPFNDSLYDLVTKMEKSTFAGSTKKVETITTR